MSDCRDLTSQLAKELTKGIRSEVEDLAGVFKRMAILKTDEEKQAFADSKAAPRQPAETLPELQVPVVQPIVAQGNPVPANTEPFVFFVSRQSKKTKTAVRDENQLSFFGWDTDFSQSA